ncbi:hypothetical protein V6N11_081829 [Hibiscus sabdariffa]|uniref:RNase H type-1 domain-containing protein n=1 Tax=Hibiscus sabdariffa TaxID=183260 RepID=A0ABR2Q7B1_9ROSI
MASLEWSSVSLKAIRIIDVAIASDHASIILLLQGNWLEEDATIVNNFQRHFQQDHNRNNVECAYEEVIEACHRNLESRKDHVMTYPHWYPSGNGFIKVNSNACFDSASRLALVVVVARDSSGSIIGGDSASFLALSTSTVEAFALRFEVLFALRAENEKFVFELDNIGNISRLNSRAMNMWETSAFEQDILYLVLSFSCFNFSYVSSVLQ